MELMEANGHTEEGRAGGAVSIRDLEVAVVLAREMSAASSRAVEASLRADQIQEVFGAAALDDPERVRIQTALEMAGLRPTPSLLEVEPDGAVRFAVNNEPAPSPSQQPAKPGHADSPPAEEAASPPAKRSEFPTVTEFAKTTFARLRGRERPATPAAGGANGASAAAPAAATPAPAAGATPAPDAGGAPRLDQLISVLIPAIALPVVVTTMLGWLFGLPFIALGVILSGFYLGKARADGATTGVKPVLKAWEPARKVLKGVALLTAAAFVVAIALGVATGSRGDSRPDVDFPAAPVTTPLGDDTAARSESREARTSVKRAGVQAERRARANRRLAARRREAARLRRAIRRRDRLIREGLLLPNGLLTNEGVARGIKRPDAPPQAPRPAPPAPAPAAPAPAPAPTG